MFAKSFTSQKGVFAFLLLLLLLIPNAHSAERAGEYIILSGAPSLKKWEKYRLEPHDHWWGNFIRAARVRIQQIRDQKGAKALISWLVYRPGYLSRSIEDGRPLLSYIESVRDKYSVNLIYFDTTAQLLNYINHGMNRQEIKIVNFEFFGHSNRACFMFDYSNKIANGSKAWLHENDLKGAIARGIFDRRAYIKSWGCHTAESMSKKWKWATGRPMWGAIGKVDYSNGHLRGWVPALSNSDGRWAR